MENDLQKNIPSKDNRAKPKVDSPGSSFMWLKYNQKDLGHELPVRDVIRKKQRWNLSMPSVLAEV